MPSEIGKLANLGVLGIGRKNTPDAVGPVPASESVAVVPKEFAENIGITFIGLIHGRAVWLYDNDFGATGFLEFFEQPIIETTDFNDWLLEKLKKTRCS